MKFNILVSIIVYLIPVILCILAYKFKNKWFIYAFLVFTFLMSAFRFNIATDFSNYYNRAFYRTELGLSFSEPIEMLFFFIASKSGMPRLFFMLNAAVVTICGYILYYQYRRQKYHELMLIAFYFIVLVTNLITRYGTATAVCCTGVYFLIYYRSKKVNTLYYFLIATLAFFFHTGAIITFAFPVMLYIYDLIKSGKGIHKYSYTLMMAAIAILLPLSVIVGDFLVNNIIIFDKYTLYFKYFKECVPSNVFLFTLMVAVLTGIGYLFDRISLTYGSSQYIKVFSIGTLMFLFFIVISLFQKHYIIDVMRIGVIFGFQGIMLFVFIFLDKAKSNGRIRFSIILSIFIFIVLFYAILDLSNAFPYNSNTIVPWKSGATYRERIPD